ncbi:hypothetical protein [uncultured Pseudacidovorax sp.]|uniref:hypothetical protein n=1 Tax=uncultured Pseudacidovorax sp. TaxID=679313 RepID=UPI0025FAD7DE|nr:hypothetical protein [uncultured Pseudacidovorax sp.]
MPKRAQSKAQTQGLVTLAELARSIEIHGDSGALAPKLAKAQRIIEHAGIPVLATQGTAPAEDVVAAFAAPDEWAVSLLDAEGIRRVAADEKALTARMTEDQARKIDNGRYTLLEAVSWWLGRPLAELTELLDGANHGRTIPPMTDEEAALLQKLKRAAVLPDGDERKLRMYRPGFGVSYDYPEGAVVREEYEEANASDLNAWLDAYSGGIGRPLPGPRASTAGDAEQGPKLRELATKDQLIEAFGKLTGMNEKWFNKVQDIPALDRARISLGGGGRTPLFCPYKVLQWLLDPNRRKGRDGREPLNPETGWRVYENRFRLSYEAHRDSDPRQFD